MDENAQMLLYFHPAVRHLGMCPTEEQTQVCKHVCTRGVTIGECAKLHL